MRLIGNVEKDAQVRAVASGALPSGDAVVVNSDGTVSVVGNNGPVSAGVPTTFQSGTSAVFSASFDTNQNKVLVLYRNASNFGVGVVGTVSGETISFGTPIVFNSDGTSNFVVVYDENALRHLILFRDTENSDRSAARVATISGTSFSLGTKTYYSFVQPAYTRAVYDAFSQKIVIFQADVPAGNHLKAYVATISGTSMSVGTVATVESASSYTYMPVYDANAQKVVITYRTGSPQKFTSKVGTVSGTSISFGTAATITGVIPAWGGGAYDTVSQKVVYFFQDSGNSSYGTAVVGTVGGTSVSYETPVVFKTAAVDRLGNVAYNSLSQSFVFGYRDDGDLDKGKFNTATLSGTTLTFGSERVIKDATFLLQPTVVYDSNAEKVVFAYTDSTNTLSQGLVLVPSTNLTSENYIGFAAHTYADTQSALVNSTCTVDRNQTGLTAGQIYYVQTDGSLGTTAGDPSVVAGTAISSTEIIVKG